MCYIMPLSPRHTTRVCLSWQRRPNRTSCPPAAFLPPAPSVAQGDDPTPLPSLCCCCLPPPLPRCAPPLSPTAPHPAGEHPTGQEVPLLVRSAPAGLPQEQFLSTPPAPLCLFPRRHSHAPAYSLCITIRRPSPRKSQRQRAAFE